MELRAIETVYFILKINTRGKIMENSFFKNEFKLIKLVPQLSIQHLDCSSDRGVVLKM